MSAAPVRQERGKQFWTVENLTSAPFLLVLSTVCLCVLGVVMVFSASSIEAVESGAAAWKEFSQQALFMVVSLVACLVVRAIGTEVWASRRWFYLLLVIIYVLLVAVLVMGRDSHGATRWIQIGPMSLQPSEFAKIVVILGAARVFALWERREATLSTLVVQSVLFIAVPFVLILVQKDLGTLLIMGASIFMMAILAGVRARTMLLVFAVCCVAVALLILSAGYRSSRFTIWLDPYSDYYGDGWQPIHGLYAFASGGFFGLGLGNSRQKYSYLPEAENDYIFAIIGEELGFLGALLVIGLFVLWGWSGMRIAYQARERSRVSSLAASGLTVLILVQALLNMGGVLGVLPLSGRPLPFISSGGSSILTCLIIVGLLLGVGRDNDLAASGVRAGERSRALRAERAHLTVIDGGQPPERAPRPARAGEPAREPRAGRERGGDPARRAPAGEMTGVPAREPRAGREQAREPRAGRPGEATSRAYADAAPRRTRYDAGRDGAQGAPGSDDPQQRTRAPRDERGRR